MPDAVALPEIAPVLLFKTNPAGIVPAVRLQVYGAVPPLADNVAL